MSQIKLEGQSLDSFCEDVVTICGLDSNIVEEIILNLDGQFKVIVQQDESFIKSGEFVIGLQPL
jgi:hypothetical protein